MAVLLLMEKVTPFIIKNTTVNTFIQDHMADLVREFRHRPHAPYPYHLLRLFVISTPVKDRMAIHWRLEKMEKFGRGVMVTMAS